MTQCVAYVSSKRRLVSLPSSLLPLLGVDSDDAPSQADHTDWSRTLDSILSHCCFTDNNQRAHTLYMIGSSILLTPDVAMADVQALHFPVPFFVPITNQPVLFVLKDCSTSTCIDLTEHLFDKIMSQLLREQKKHVKSGRNQSESMALLTQQLQTTGIGLSLRLHGEVEDDTTLTSIARDLSCTEMTDTSQLSIAAWPTKENMDDEEEDEEDDELDENDLQALGEDLKGDTMDDAYDSDADVSDSGDMAVSDDEEQDMEDDE